MFACLMDWQNRRVFQLGQRAHFEPETRSHLGRAKLLRQEHLQGDSPMGFQLARAVNNAHAAAGDFFEQFITGNTH
jgi:hypothetical protein